MRRFKLIEKLARPLRNRRGFTLIELMVVLIILGLLGAIVYQAVIPQKEKAMIQATKTQMDIFGLALDNYRLDVNRYPDGLEELISSGATGWKGPYLRKNSIPLDPWGNPYSYQAVDNGADFKLSSSGNGKEPIVHNE